MRRHEVGWCRICSCWSSMRGLACVGGSRDFGFEFQLLGYDVHRLWMREDRSLVNLLRMVQILAAKFESRQRGSHFSGWLSAGQGSASTRAWICLSLSSCLVRGLTFRPVVGSSWYIVWVASWHAAMVERARLSCLWVGLYLGFLCLPLRFFFFRLRRAAAASKASS